MLRLVALVILHGLMSNSRRYENIERLAAEGNHTNAELTDKNIYKAFTMADQFLRFKYKRKR